MAPRSRGSVIRARILSGLLPFLGLILLWMLLWGQFTWLALLTGAALAAIVSIVFYLPAVRFSGHLDPLRAIWFLVRLAVDMVVASIQVAGIALGPKRLQQSAVIQVALRTRSDIVMVFTSEALSLVPGSILLDVDREEATLLIHTIGVRDDAAAELAKRKVLETERRIILAFGSHDDRARLDQEATT
ncbi:Na+/H+ antiporter subunit E [Cnuibacter physcomitrellae]|uniref:Na+/H+ antiporter subunit E n=1 Tax=Cnuibacter physcomitrellae TaxID=1619308 RepID=UPI002175FA44|nr:Na+/H+ antiporter subunit E [Cnuibacter physcomitrellae]MCS5497655.1 Na+/H+ antiporter subunit E [Cnuibacter physcomitrellae]